MSEKLKLPRTDIQALRGLAVLFVVLYHTKLVPVSAGYLGVDIFFVISGYLITTLVASGIESGTFRLPDFYFRRAKRLLPAAYFTFAVTAALAPWFLNQLELRDFATQMVGAVTFSGNFVLWQQTGYFQGAGDLKPLLHVWSLAIEEQYYFILPAVLLFTPAKKWLRGATALVVFSLALCIAGGLWKPIATFYLIPTRAWELLIGSAGALWMLRKQQRETIKIERAIDVLFLPAIFCLVLLPFTPFNGMHPGANAVMVCVATVVVILRNSPRLNTALPTTVLAKVGDFSYSLYLVHWPIIAFIKNAWVGSSLEVPLQLRITAFALSFIIAYLLYRLVEEPIRRSRIKSSRQFVGLAMLSSLLLILITPAVMSISPLKIIDFNEVRKINYGFSEECEYKTLFAPKMACQSTTGNPNLLVWGDSYAMHLVPGLVQEWGSGGLVQATRSQCGPFLGLAPRLIVKSEEGNNIDQTWAENCIKFNQSVIDYLRKTPSIETVVLSSPFSQYVTKEKYEHVTLIGSKYVSSALQIKGALASLHRTVVEIRKLGKKVVLIAPPPSSDFNIGGCLERQLSKAVTIGGRSGCVIDRSEYQNKRSEVLRFLNLAANDSDLSVIRFDSELCDTKTCKTIIDGTMIYRDEGHLSYDGSRLIAKRMQLANQIQMQAR